MGRLVRGFLYTRTGVHVYGPEAVSRLNGRLEILLCRWVYLGRQFFSFFPLFFIKYWGDQGVNGVSR